MSENTSSSAVNVNETAATTASTSVAVPASNNATPPSGSALSSLLPLVLMIAAFYFLLIRPQNKREAKRREMINAVKRGDRVITAGGIIGNVHKIIDEREISLEIAENVRMRILKTAITEVLKNSEKSTESTADADENAGVKTSKTKSSAKTAKANAKESAGKTK